MAKISALGKTILELRKAQKMTQGDLAKKVGVSTNSISQFEKGGLRPSAETLAKLSEALGEDLRLLLPGDGAVPVRLNEENIEVAIIRGTRYGTPNIYRVWEDIEDTPDWSRAARENTASRVREATKALSGTYDAYEALTLPPSMLTAPASRHRAFPMPGNGMAPTFEEGDLLVMRQLDSSEWHTIKADKRTRKRDLADDLPVYAVYSGNAYGKSVDFCRASLTKDKQSISLYYDMRNFYPRTISLAQVTAIWKFEWLLSRRSPNLKDKINDLEHQLVRALEKIKELEAQRGPSEA